MSYTILKLVDEPILIVHVDGNVTPAIHHQICVEVANLLDHVPGLIYRVNDLAQAHFSLSNMSRIIAQGLKGWPGTISDPRVISLGVMKDSNAILGTHHLLHKWEGGRRMRTFFQVSDALAYARGHVPGKDREVKPAAAPEADGSGPQYPAPGERRPSHTAAVVMSLDDRRIVVVHLTGMLKKDGQLQIATRVADLLRSVEGRVYLVIDLTGAQLGLMGWVEVAAQMKQSLARMEGDPRVIPLLVVDSDGALMGFVPMLRGPDGSGRIRTFMDIHSALAYAHDQLGGPDAEPGG